MIRHNVLNWILLIPLAWVAQLTSAESLTWDAVSKHVNSKRGDTNTLFVFNLSNDLANDVVISEVNPECGCTIAKFPDLPWVVGPGEIGEIAVDVDLSGRTGILTKTIDVVTSVGTNILTVNVKFPELTQREKNQRRAFTDRQAVFKTGCADCHWNPAKEKTGKALFDGTCAICHQAEHRAEMVPDLAKTESQKDLAYWNQWIRRGKPGTFMPAFEKRFGGPLTEEQIASLVEYLSGRFDSP